MNRALLTYRPIVKFFLLIMGILLGAGVLQAAEYEVDGVIYVTLTHYNPPMEFKSEFTVYVRDCAWLISTIGCDQHGALRGKRETGCTNGTEIFDMRTSVIAMSNPSGIRSHTEIKSNSVPIGAGDDDRPEHLLADVCLPPATGGTRRTECSCRCITSSPSRRRTITT